MINEVDIDLCETLSSWKQALLKTWSSTSKTSSLLSHCSLALLKVNFIYCTYYKDCSFTECWFWCVML